MGKNPTNPVFFTAFVRNLRTRTRGVINRVRISHATSLSNIWYGCGWLDDTVHSVQFCFETNNYDQGKKIIYIYIVPRACVRLSHSSSSPGVKGTVPIKHFCQFLDLRFTDLFWLGIFRLSPINYRISHPKVSFVVAISSSITHPKLY